VSAAEWAAVLGAAATVVSSLASLVVAIRTGQKTAATHELVNGQSTALNDAIGRAARAEGRAEGTPGVVGKIPTDE